MKLSDYKAKRLSFHSSRHDVGFCGKRGERMYSEAAAEDVAAAEAAGVVWDPEEKPLPDSLILYESLTQGWEIIPGRKEGDYAILGTWRYPPEEQRRTTLREAVRRYNAWPELEKLAEEPSGGLVILDEPSKLRELFGPASPGYWKVVDEKNLSFASVRERLRAILRGGAQ